MRKWTLRALILLAAIAAILLLKATVLAPDPLVVEVSEVGAGKVEETVTNSRAGTVRARRRARLSPEIGGQVVALPYREGDRVEAGATLLKLDDSLQRARVELATRDREAAKAERERACLAAERAGREARRVERLAAEQIISADLADASDSQSQTAEASCRAAQAGEARAAAALSVAETELTKTVLRAPFDGLVAEVSIEVGEWTTPSPPAMPVPPVIDVLDPSSIYISAPMDEVDSARIHAGQPARVTVDSYRDRVFSGRVTRVAPYVLDIEEQNRTVEVEVELADGELAARLLPGTSADIEVILDEHENVLRVPTAALIEGRRVLALEDGKLVDKPIETGLRNWEFTEVTGGLGGGERIVVSLDRPEIRAGAAAEAAPAGDDQAP